MAKGKNNIKQKARSDATPQNANHESAGKVGQFSYEGVSILLP